MAPLYIFISHSSKDNEFGLKLAQDLRQALGTTHNIWYDGLSIRPGEDWLHSINEQIDHCDFFILIVTPDAMKSPWVEREFNAAYAKFMEQEGSVEQHILPILWKECNRWPFLAALQHIDFQNVDYPTALNNLLAALKISFGMETPPASGEPPSRIEAQIRQMLNRVRGSSHVQDWQHVLQLTDDIMQQFPGAVPAEVYYWRGQAFLEQGELTQAENALNVALAIESDQNLHLQCLHLLKRTLQQAGNRWEDLLRVAENALLLNPEDEDKEWTRLRQQALNALNRPVRRIRPLPPPSLELLSILNGHRGTVYDLSWGPGEQELASASADKTVRIWSINGDENELKYVYTKHRGWVTAVGWSPDGTWLASGSYDKSVRIWHPERGEYMQWTHRDLVNDVAWSPDGRYVASASADKTVQVWDIQTQKQITVYRGHRHWVNAVAWSPDGQRIASGGQDRTVHIWNMRTAHHELIFDRHTASINDLTWSPGGTDIASASTDKTVCTWSTTGAPGFAKQEHDGYVLSLTRSRYGRRMASASNNSITIWYTATRAIILTSSVHTGLIWAVAWSPDDTYIASAGEDRQIRLWSLIDDVV